MPKQLARVCRCFSSRLQVQERLTKQIADWLQARTVRVVLEAEHLCMSVRRVCARGSETVTSALLGQFREGARSRQEFFDIIGISR